MHMVGNMVHFEGINIEMKYVQTENNFRGLENQIILKVRGLCDNAMGLQKKL